MRFKVFIKYLFLSLLALVIIGQALFLALPVLVDTLLVERLIQRHLPKALPQGLVPSDLKFKIEKIGLTHALVSRIHIGQMLSADIVDFQYHLKDLKKFELEKITIFGLNLYAQVDADNQLRLNGEKFLGKINNAQEDKGAQEDQDAQKNQDDTVDIPPVHLDSFLDFLPKQVVLKNATLSITTRGKKILIPFEVLSSLNTRKKKAVLNARFYPLGQTIKTIIAGDLTDGIERVRIQAPAFHPEVLADFFPQVETLRISGPVDIDILKICSDTTWQLSLSQVKLDLPKFPGTQIKNLTASWEKQAEKIAVSGGFDLASSLTPTLAMHFSLDLAQEKNPPSFFDLTIKNKAVNSVALNSIDRVTSSQEYRFDHPRLLFSLKGDLAHQTGKVLLSCQNLMVTRNKDRLLVKNFAFTSGIKGDFSDQGKGLDFDIQSDLSKIKLFSKAGQAEIMGATLTGNARVTKQMDPLIHLDTRINAAKIDASEVNIKAVGINARLPLVFPFKNENIPGSFSIKEIDYDNKFTATLVGKITQSELLGVALEGQATIAGIDNFNLGFDGRAGGADPSARINFVIDPFLLMPAHMKKIMPALTLGEDSSVQLSSKGTIEYKHHGMKSHAAIVMDGGNLFFPDMNLSLRGIAGRIDFNDLMVPESIPGQVLTIDKIQVNQFELDTAKVRFSIEDGNAINIENLRFNWCNGLVSTESIRLPGKDNLLSLILYCDRLELSDLLEQIGAFHAEGKGTLSGRIPLVYSNGDISFDKGFLFSTPGQGGKVVIENTQTLTAGIPFGTPEFVQLDLAREALKDFEYQWAKLELNTLEDTLYMKLELDGKPARLLPFEYQQEIGSFVRVDATSPGSKFQGIKLNVNLKLPFNRVLKFGNKLNSIFN